MELRVEKWGTSLALRLPEQVVRELRLYEGPWIELQIQKVGKATLRPASASDKADYLARVRALTSRMPEGEPVVRHMRDTGRY